MDRHLPAAPVTTPEEIPILLAKDDAYRRDAMPPGGDGGPLAQASELDDDEINQALIEMLGQVANEQPFSRKAAEQPPQPGAPNPPPPPAEDAHAVFDRMGLAMRQPTTFNLGRINRDREFDAIEAGIDFDELTGGGQGSRKAPAAASVLPAGELADDELAAELSALMATPVPDLQPVIGKVRASGLSSASSGHPGPAVPARPVQVAPPVVHSAPTAQAYGESVPVPVVPAGVVPPSEPQPGPAAPPPPAAFPACSPLQAVGMAAGVVNPSGFPAFATQAAWTPHPGYVVPSAYGAHLSSGPPGYHPTLLVAQPASIFSAPPMVAAMPLPAGAVPMSTASPARPETSNG